jgi:hypothetical protein
MKKRWLIRVEKTIKVSHLHTVLADYGAEAHDLAREEDEKEDLLNGVLQDVKRRTVTVGGPE